MTLVRMENSEELGKLYCFSKCFEELVLYAGSLR